MHQLFHLCQFEKLSMQVFYGQMNIKKLDGNTLCQFVYSKQNAFFPAHITLSTNLLNSEWLQQPRVQKASVSLLSI